MVRHFLTTTANQKLRKMARIRLEKIILIVTCACGRIPGRRLRTRMPLLRQDIQHLDPPAIEYALV